MSDLADGPPDDRPDDWPFADDPSVCAACGSDDDRSVVVEGLGLVWSAAMDGGPSPTDLSDYSGVLAFRCCHDCWTGAGIDALEDAGTLVDHDVVRTGGKRFVLDDAKVAAAAELDAGRVALAKWWPIDARSGPEREHVRAQDEAIEALLESWFVE